MEATEIIRERQAIIERSGAWAAHNIYLGDGIYTIGEPTMGGSDGRLRRIVQLCADLVPSFDGLRVADLGAGEGALGVEFAARGAEVVLVEGRETPMEKVRFVKTVLGLEKLELVQDDVRNFTVERFGKFDIVVAVGIVYHLDMPEVFDFLANIHDATSRFAVIDGEVLPERRVRASDSFHRNGVTYRGQRWKEPHGDPRKIRIMWSAIGNPYSFMFTRDSLMNALRASGFTSVLECHVPTMPEARPRVTVLATAGTPQKFVTAPTLHEAAPGLAYELHTIPGWMRPAPLHLLWARLPEKARLTIKSRILPRIRSRQ